MAFLHRNSHHLQRFVAARNANLLKTNRSNSHYSVESDTSSSDQSAYGQLYPEHIPTSTFQKILLSVGSSLITISNPYRGDMLATFGETSGAFALGRMKRQMELDTVGQQILLEKPRINTKSVDLDYLRSLPDGTFGKEYVTWLKDNHASPDERLPVSFVDDPELAYVMQRYREIHDLMHTVLGMPTTMIGEVAVKVFEGIQTGLPMCVTGGVFGTFRLGPKHLRIYLNTHLQWAIRNGWNARPMMNVYYEKHWQEPVSEFRHFMNITDPPNTPRKKF